METHSGLFSFTKTRQQGTRGCTEENRGCRQWEVSSCKASLIFFNEQKQERDLMCCFMQVRAEVSVVFFEPSPWVTGRGSAGRVHWDWVIWCCASVSRPRPKNFQTHRQSSAKAFAFNINLSRVEKSCNKQALRSIHVASNRRAKIQTAGCCLLPLILRPLSVKKEKGEVREEFLLFYDDKWGLALNPRYCPNEQFITVK